MPRYSVCQTFVILFYLIARCQLDANRCEEVIEMEMSDDDIDTIVGLHNDLRRKVASGQEDSGSPGPQPTATFMPDLVWDDELAEAAWQWAQNCEFQHDPNLNDMQMGQNIAITFNSRQLTTPNWADSAIYPWYSEVENVDCRSISSFTSLQARNGQNIGHYTQMVWAGTTAVGCASIGYSDYSIPEMPFRILYVCNYSPPGNYIDQPVYEVDFSSSYCPDD
ncbi:hypothetical protein GHT06_010196 [Daphnia sinensis]|uniref:SCP domain-containing protein n=1 Tax=Daphnia sinensis TaxID=1820382 RepID=A0AAD5PX86_9CRUS|nr:hypothetical protein GHT06_010196 [Daphnia sinensis]